LDSELARTVDFITNYCRQPQPVLGLVLGSGLGRYADSFEDRTVLPFSKIPNFRNPSISGHAGNLVFGAVEGVPCVALQGRLHFYEGCSMREIALPIRALGCLGISLLIVTNAAGGINPAFVPGDLMLIEDHINLMGSNPLIGRTPNETGRQFPDMSTVYDAPMRETALEVARRKEIVLRRGIYAAVTGPMYETPAEIRMYRTLGADAVGMSTVPEVTAAVQMGIRVLGISCITNMAAGMSPGGITHGEVLEETEKAAAKFCSLLDGIIKAVANSQ
jgi:purine-nucleoside phosphorylase